MYIILLIEFKHGLDAYKTEVCYATPSFHSHQISTWRSLGENKAIHNFGRIVIILKLSIQSTKISGMKRERIPVHLANNTTLNKIQWVAKIGFTSHLN